MVCVVFVFTNGVSVLLNAGSSIAAPVATVTVRFKAAVPVTPQLWITMIMAISMAGKKSEWLWLIQTVGGDRCGCCAVWLLCGMV